jgi:proteasome lid subunit RPN8/RPN11
LPAFAAFVVVRIHECRSRSATLDGPILPIVLTIGQSVYFDLLAHLIDGLPDEACGLFAGTVEEGDHAVVTRFYPSVNVAASSRVYTIDPKTHLRADMDAEDAGLEILGVVHSHTHTEPYPSPTDIQQAPDPAWHYIIVSFRTGVPALRSYWIIDGSISEEAVSLVGD